MTPALHIFAEPKPDQLWCEKCGALKTVILDVEFENGILSSCQGCGDERVIPYTRTMEAA
jgi:RNase P subunit RPR2